MGFSFSSLKAASQGCRVRYRRRGRRQERLCKSLLISFRECILLQKIKNKTRRSNVTFCRVIQIAMPPNYFPSLTRRGHPLHRQAVGFVDRDAVSCGFFVRVYMSCSCSRIKALNFWTTSLNCSRGNLQLNPAFLAFQSRLFT